MLQEKICGSCKRVFKEEKDFLDKTSQWRLCSSENLWFNCACGSTLMLPKGKFPWYSPTLNLSDEAATIFNKMAGMRELPHIPSAVMQIQQLLLDPEHDTPQLAKAVRKDPFLATEVIRVAENLRRVRQVSAKVGPSLEYAITFIGRRHLANLVMAASIKNFKLNTKYFDSSEFWDPSFLTAGLAEVIATNFVKAVDRDKAYLAGSMANIGKIVGAISYPEKIDATSQRANNLATQSTWTQAETHSDLPNHCLLGEIGAAFWGIPEFVIAAIKYHHQPQNTPDGPDRDICHIAALANMLAHWVRLEPHRIDEALLAQEIQHFGISKQHIENLASETLAQLEKTG